MRVKHDLQWTFMRAEPMDLCSYLVLTDQDSIVCRIDLGMGTMVCARRSRDLDLISLYFCRAIVVVVSLVSRIVREP